MMTVKGKGSKVVEHVEKVDKGVSTVVHDKNVETPITVPANYATVNVNLGGKRGLPNYSSLSVGVSLTLPCAPEEAVVEETYLTAKAWCLKRVDDLFDAAMGE